MHRHPVIPPLRGVGRRTLLAGVAAVLVGQAATVYAIHRMVSARPAAAAAPAPPAAGPSRGEGRFGAVDDRRLPVRFGAPAPEGSPLPTGRVPMPMTTMKTPAVRASWSDRPLDDESRKLAEEIGRPADELRLLADGHGRVTDAARRDLLAGRDAGRRLAQQLGVATGREDELAQAMVGFMVRRVTMRESFRGTSVTPGAIDDAARTDALASVESAFDPQAKDAVAAALPGLPDLTADLPPPAP
jgi:hypothetical protein